MKKYHNQTAVSLFAFQDIITGITAIVLLITLLLMIELIARKTFSQLQRISPETIELLDIVEEMASDEPLSVTKLSKSLTTKTTELEVNQRIQALEENIEALTVSKKDSLEILEDTRQQLSSIRSIHQDELSKKKQTDELVKRIQRNQTRLNEIQSKSRAFSNKKAELEVKAGVPAGPPILSFYNIEGNSKKSWLLILSEEGIVINSLVGKEEFTWADKNSTRQFARWINRNRSNVEHCVVLVRPSGITKYDDVWKTLTKENIPIGTEAIGETQNVLIKPNQDYPL
jgi:hypothetical protein